MQLFQWRGRTSKKEFRKRFIELMRRTAPQVRYVESEKDELDLSVEGLTAGTTATISLHRGYDEFLKAPEERDEILARWVTSQRSIVDPQPLSADNILPMIKSRAWLSDYYSRYNQPPEPGSERDMLYEEINEEFLLTYAERAGGIRYLHISALEDLRLTREDLRTKALANLRASSEDREIRLAGDVWMIFDEKAPISSLMLDDEVWRDPRLAHLDPLVIAAPERNSLVAATGASPAEIWHLAFMAAGLAKQEAYPISPQLMIRRNGQFELLDPRLVDESHPIPDLGVIDVSVSTSAGERVAIVVGSPLDAQPRSVYRLFRKLESYLAHLGCNDTSKNPVAADSKEPKIYLRIHPGTDPEVLDLVRSLGPNVKERGATLEVNVTE